MVYGVSQVKLPNKTIFVRLTGTEHYSPLQIDRMSSNVALNLRKKNHHSASVNYLIFLLPTLLSPVLKTCLKISLSSVSCSNSFSSSM